MKKKAANWSPRYNKMIQFHHICCHKHNPGRFCSTCRSRSVRHTLTSSFKAEAPKIQTTVNIQQANWVIDCFTTAIVEQFQNQYDKTVNDISKKKTNLGQMLHYLTPQTMAGRSPGKALVAGTGSAGALCRGCINP